MNNDIYFKNHEGYYDPTAGKAMTNYQKNRGGATMVQEIRRGDIYCREKKNSEELEYFLIISREDRCKNGTNMMVAKLSEERVNLLPTQTNVICRGKMTVNCDILNYVYRGEVGEYIRSATDEEMKTVNICLCKALGLPTINSDSLGKEECDKKIKELTEENRRLLKEVDNLKNEINNFQSIEVFENESDEFGALWELREENIKLTAERDIYRTQFENMLCRFVGSGSVAQ